MREFHSFLQPMIGQFIEYRQVSNKWCPNNEANLYYFDVFCKNNFPTVDTLQQEMVDIWCATRPTETNHSRNCRIFIVKIFVQFLNARGLSLVHPPEYLPESPSTYIPHAFTKAELATFFEACDSIGLKKHAWVCKARQITIPVFFRLLFSSGIRTNEARLLRTEDVDLETGVLSIVYSKGPNQHFVVLHDSMLQLMRNYDREIRKLITDRIYFFPTQSNGHYCREWVMDNFDLIWKSCGFGYATAYTLRHNYATANINRGVFEPEFGSKFTYLSKSMGHSTLESTKYYYSLVPEFAGILRKTSEASFNEIIPEVDEHEN